jgi:glycosyltransferase involved in cell wall biosynthesis
VPLVVIFHGFDAFQDITLQTYFEAYQQLFMTAAALVVVSEPMREQLIKLGAPPDRIQLNSCGVDPSAFIAAEPGSAPPTFLAVGRFVGKKGPLHTIDAFARVHQRQPESRLRMIGSGPLLAECRARADQLGLAEAITFLGDCPHATVQEQMHQVHTVVQHSLRCVSGNQEGTPVALIEAQMAGLPVVSTLHAGIPAVVIHGRTGFLVAEGDVEGMAAAMLRLAKEPALAASMGVAARGHALEHHTLDRHIRALADTLQHAIASAAPPAP